MSQQDLHLMDDAALREHLRAWLAQHCPTDPRRPMAPRLYGTQGRAWLRTLYDHGLRAPGWPRAFGGMGLSLRQQLIYQQEMERANAPRVIDLGTTLLGPVLMQYGTPEQQRHLQRILAMDEVWCQGYSEPNAGSDLASLRTAAVAGHDEAGEHFVINGQKIWTTRAGEATHIFLLVRTSRHAKKQQGITFLLADMATPGITVRPIGTLSGEAEFYEVFFDDVRVPAANVVGNVDDGWAVSKALLGFERVSIGSPMQAKQAFRVLWRLLVELGLTEAPALAERLGALACDLHDVSSLYAEVCEAALAGEALHTEPSMLKVMASELFQRIADFAIEVAQEHGGVRGKAPFGGSLIDLHQLHMLARPVTIYSGANEIQRDLIARHFLPGNAH